MNTVKFEKGNALVVAHRGLSGIERENTNAAFVAAANRSYYGIETDIWRTSDGKFILNHDPDFSHYGGVGCEIEKTPFEDLRKIILTDKGGTRGRYDLRPSTLEEYIGICKRYEKRAVLELKSNFTDGEIAEIINTIDVCGYLEGVTFISFGFENLLKVRKILPDAVVQYLLWELNEANFKEAVDNSFDVDVAYKKVTPEWIERLHTAGVKINVWTVDTKDVAEEFVRLGIDFITTNILE